MSLGTEDEDVRHCDLLVDLIQDEERIKQNHEELVYAAKIGLKCEEN